MDKIHSFTDQFGDKLSFINYGDSGVTVALTVHGEWFDVGLAPDQTQALIEWLQSTQQNRN